jgi:hypothetical protein
MHHLKKVLPILVCLGFITYIIIATPYPNTWQEASWVQILGVFIPLLILLTLTFELFIKYLPKSFILAIGFWLIILFQALNVLTPVLVVALLALSILLARLYPKHKLSLRTKIPKLRLSNEPKKSTLTRSERRKRA